MRFVRTLGALLLAAAVSQAASIVERHGALKTMALADGAHVVDQAGNPLQLTGVSMGESQWWGSYFNKSIVDWLVADWQISVIRTPMGIDDTLDDGTGTIRSAGGYLTKPTQNLATISKVIDAAVSDGIYVVIDWHEQDAANHTAQAQAFFSMMAKKYGDLPNVIFEIWNEPYNGTADWAWSDIKTYAQAVIPSIRQYSKNLVVVGTPEWSGDIASAATDPLDPATYGSVAYTFHFYSCSNKLAGQTSTSKQIPIFVTEWGSSQSNGGTTASGANDKTNCLTTSSRGTAAQTWYTSWMDPQKISSCNWYIANKDESSAALKVNASPTGNWNDTDLSPSGVWVRTNIRAHCTSDPSVCPYEGAYVPAPVLSVPGTIPATSTSILGGVTSEPTQEATGGRNLTSIDSLDYATYSIHADTAQVLWFKARVADTSGGTILVQLDGVTADSIRVYPTGGVQTWSWADGIRQVGVAAGDHSLNLRFLGKGRDLMRLQRLEVLSKNSPATPVPGQVSLEDFNGALTGVGLGTVFADPAGPSIRQATTRSSAAYKVYAAAAETLSLSVVAANGGTNPSSLVVYRKAGLSFKPFDTIVVAPSGWNTWQTLTMSRNLPLDSGANALQFTFLGDTGKAILDIGALSIGSAVTRVQPVRSTASRISLRREGGFLRVEVPEGSGEAALELLSADGRVWARQTVSGTSLLPLPNTRVPLWVRLRGRSNSVLSVPPGF